MPAIAPPVREQQQVHYLPRAEVDPWALDEPTIAQPTRYIDHCLPQAEVDPWAPDEPAVARPARYIDYAGKVHDVQPGGAYFWRPADEDPWAAEDARSARQDATGSSQVLKVGDLTKKTGRELRQLADQIGVDVKGCLEKGEFVEKIANSPKVEVVREGYVCCGAQGVDHDLEVVATWTEETASDAGSGCDVIPGCECAASSSWQKVRRSGPSAMTKGTAEEATHQAGPAGAALSGGACALDDADLLAELARRGLIQIS